ncbi:thiamine diphosphokinase [Weeksellaceae bacterium KMM 9724]|uniref:thiamine diphosphokinase n=1 Tax=Profundicola chukchiensis TaxID=2961959 RepID=UPI00243E0AA1|nr:thiamine diphosphokinase [Profundicola chukchiensis]MDG4949994.1 thiamine diphosphokinase [Profundicola chukchiensis]
MKALLIINGQPPKDLPDISNYEKIYCTDGAYAFLLGKQIRPDYVIGDFDSVSIDDISPFVEVLERPDQDFTDFEKSLQIIEEHGYDSVDVYGSTGQESDHFLGNLSTALNFKNRLNITFYDDYSIFFFADKSIELEGVKNRVISLVPFHKAIKVNSKGLKFPLEDLDLRLGKRMGTRNYANEDVVEINYESGELIVFISNYEREDDH